jgi:hypothetical protein
MYTYLKVFSGILSMKWFDDFIRQRFEKGGRDFNYTFRQSNRAFRFVFFWNRTYFGNGNIALTKKGISTDKAAASATATSLYGLLTGRPARSKTKITC